MRIVSYLGLLLACVFVFVLPSAMHADTFQWSEVGPIFSGAGTFDAVSDGGNMYTIDGVSGTVYSILPPTTIVGVLAPGTFHNNDNILFYPGQGLAASEYFGSKGAAFQTANGYYVDFSNSGIVDVGTAAAMNDLNDPFQQFDLVLVCKTAATPELSSLALLGTGLLGLAGFARRKVIRA